MVSRQLSSCAVMHVLKEITFDINLVTVLREFAPRNESRKEVFGKC
jgi:hypothetical protein